MGVPGVGEHECVMIENQRWSIRHREYRNDALMVKVDPPPFCTQDGRATSIEQLNRAMERNLLARTPGSAVKAWRWKEGSRWRATEWEYALAFQMPFKPQQDRTCMVRRRTWTRTRTVIARDMSAPSTPTSGAVATDSGAHSAVRFAEGTVYERELPNKRWRVTAATRAAPHWTRQYFTDCSACEITPIRAVAAFLAAPGVSAYERQSRARLLLAEKEEWPPESPATAAAIAAEKVRGSQAQALDEVAFELQAQLVRDIVELGHVEAAEIAMQHLVFAVVNAKARDSMDGNTSLMSESIDGSVDDSSVLGDASALSGHPAVTDSSTDGRSRLSDAGAAFDGTVASDASSSSPAARRGSTASITSPIVVPDEQLDVFITQTLVRLEQEAAPAKGEIGYDTSDGWFVIDDSELFTHSPDSKKSPRSRAGDHGSGGAGGDAGGDGAKNGHNRRSATTNGSGDSHGGGDDDDESMFHSTIDRTRTSGGHERLRVSGVEVGRRLPFNDDLDEGDDGGLDIDDAMYHSATEIDPATLPTNFGKDAAQRSADGVGGGGRNSDGASPESSSLTAQTSGGTDSASDASVAPASGLGDLVDSVYFDASDVDAPAQGSTGRTNGLGRSVAEEVDVLSSSQASTASLASSYSSASSEPHHERHAASVNGADSRSNASRVIPIVVETTQSSAPRLSGSPHSSVGSPPGPKARIEAEIRMLEEIMKKNRPS